MPTPSDAARPDRGAANARRFVGKLARRTARRLDATQSKLLDEGSAIAASGPAKPSSPDRPAAPATDDVPAGVAAANAEFFRVLELHGDVAVAATATVRAHLRAGQARRARTFALIWQQGDGAVREIGNLCRAMACVAGSLLDTAWTLFSAAPIEEVLRLAAEEYFQVGFQLHPETARATLDDVIAGAQSAQADALGWLNIARGSFAAEAEEQSRFALERAREALALLPEREAKPIRQAIGWLAKWYGRRATAAEAEPAPAGEIPFGVLAYRHPDRAATSRNLGHYIESLAALSHLARRRDLELTGDTDLVSCADAMRELVPAQQAISGDTATARLYVVDRDAAGTAAVPDGAWLLVAGLLPQPIFAMGPDVPPAPRFRPLYVSVHVNSAESLTAEMLEHLREHAPIGCRDWPSTLLLLAAGVPAFFAGALTSTLDAIAGPAAAAREGRLFVDVEPDGPGDTAVQEFEAVRTREPGDNLRDALARLRDYGGRRRIVTSRLQTYLAGRALGADVRLQPENPAERRFDGLLGMDDAAFAAMQQKLTDRLAAVVGGIVSGAAPEEVYKQWRELCAADVAEAEARRADIAPMPRSAFDIAAACATILAGSTVVERCAPAPDGAEINVELSLDGNYKHQLEVVLDSIVEHASRPVRAFVLCRDHTTDDYNRLAALFPTVSFVWLPTDGVDYGPISGLLGYTTVATMDRLLLPDLLPDISRIVHHDLDALCLVDLAGLFDVELGDAPLAGRESPLASLSSGFSMFMKQAERYTRKPELGQELLRRTHGRHTFDFTVLNAGIMLLNLERMRADDFGRHFVPFVERFGMNDQAVLNVYAGGSRVEVAPGWNWRPWLEDVEEPYIAHWAGKYKPWSEPWVYGKPLWQEAEARLAARYQRAGL